MRVWLSAFVRIWATGDRCSDHRAGRLSQARWLVGGVRDLRGRARNQAPIERLAVRPNRHRSSCGGNKQTQADTRAAAAGRAGTDLTAAGLHQGRVSGQSRAMRDNNPGNYGSPGNVVSVTYSTCWIRCGHVGGQCAHSASKCLKKTGFSDGRDVFAMIQVQVKTTSGNDPFVLSAG
jgi:hypothetical protein